MMGSNVFFPTQQDFVAFDDGDDLYNNEDPDTPRSEHAENTGTSNGTSSQGQPREQQGTVHQSASSTSDIKAKTAPPNPTLPQSNSTIQPNDTATTQEVSKPDTNGQLAVLRAKLLSQRRVGGKTPTPEVNIGQKIGNEIPPAPANAAGSSNENVKSTSTGVPLSAQKQIQAEPIGVAMHSSIKPDAKSSTKLSVLSVPNSSLPQQSHTSNDIEALLAEARDTTNTIKTPSRFDQSNEKTGQILPSLGTKVAPALTPSAAKVVPSAILVSLPHNTRSSNSSSETSEQGEIREEPKKPEKALPQELPAPAATKDIQSSQMPVRTAPNQGKQPAQAQKSVKKQQPGKIDTSLAQRRNTGSTTTNSAKPKSPVSARTPRSARPKELHDPPSSSGPRNLVNKTTEVRERVTDDTTTAADRRQDYNRARVKDIQVREPYLRDSRHYDAFRPDYASRQQIIDENERAAAEYKRTLQQPKPDDRDVAMTDSVVEASKTTSRTTPTEETADYFADVNEWLDMTGYHDKSYRKKALARHRKLLALDKERAELETEAQAERELQSQIIRAQSIKPRGSVEGISRPAVAPSAFPSFTMPPPPLPAKEAADDLGIQIKDLANREAMSARDRPGQISEQLHESPKSLNPAVKRQHSGDEVESRGRRPMDKFPRTNSKDFSSDTRVPQAITGSSKPANGSLESRISVDDGNSRREYQPRSRSPEVKHRSLSPLARRDSEHEIRMARQFSRGSYGSRNGYSPNRRPAYSRDASPSQTDAGLYDDAYDGHARRYDNFRNDHYDSRAGSGYDHYGANPRGGPQNQAATYRPRGRGRARGGYSSNSYRGNHAG
ncbi:hypothetical protein MMC13_000786 [Lambiella insularis]|nr:hypothetical protein [Lambiella insularis]